MKSQYAENELFKTFVVVSYGPHCFTVNEKVTGYSINM